MNVSLFRCQVEQRLEELLSVRRVEHTSQLDCRRQRAPRCRELDKDCGNKGKPLGRTTVRPKVLPVEWMLIYSAAQNCEDCLQSTRVSIADEHTGRRYLEQQPTVLGARHGVVVLAARTKTVVSTAPIHTSLAVRWRSVYLLCRRCPPQTLHPAVPTRRIRTGSPPSCCDTARLFHMTFCPPSYKGSLPPLVTHTRS